MLTRPQLKAKHAIHLKDPSGPRTSSLLLMRKPFIAFRWVAMSPPGQFATDLFVMWIGTLQIEVIRRNFAGLS
jgi:hypothetical protein